MKELLTLFLGILIMTQPITAQIKEVTIEVNNIDLKRGGNVIVMIFSKEGFPKKHDKALVSQTKIADSEVLKFEFNLDLDEMAVKVLHDEDMDGKVTKNWSGIYPKEGLGFTNKQKVSFTGPPKYKKSMVTKEQYKNGLNISVIYP